MKITKRTKVENVLPLIGSLNPCYAARDWLAGLAEYTLEEVWADPELWWSEHYGEESWSWLDWFTSSAGLPYEGERPDSPHYPDPARAYMADRLRRLPLTKVIRALQRLEDE